MISKYVLRKQVPLTGHSEMFPKKVNLELPSEVRGYSGLLGIISGIHFWCDD